MSGNTFGSLFAVTNFGESHGPAIGCVIDGCPPGLELSEADIQPDLDRRRPGTSRHVTQRQEEDKVEILSGVYEGKTTGTPICCMQPRNTMPCCRASHFFATAPAATMGAVSRADERPPPRGSRRPYFCR